mmetsp:Transcript_3605/g.10831  ORF Transcript_3605/g.10831 Transcript_3605/m.10831 type:complete len:520 (-) Transcript_3605:194-1753(-)|eukprot:CAMPEP_0198731232 /NCGR_PEP_ID=MMETSP1475-20131203/28820_1 /TAXON_ID= ORGANISM="Unidentified sp., Strain CCMP1999" /NCGR_SAMPLE_ID=MMETSP1475 /ASSEMBLY_ACC=CAM_ASM_001111 /LENGTH=519 /DNA_ID=CAMNT_0044494171 /DNA_START=123 /DNA_END=1682 /DNA_ORIENTATION=+
MDGSEPALYENGARKRPRSPHQEGDAPARAAGRKSDEVDEHLAADGAQVEDEALDATMPIMVSSVRGTSLEKRSGVECPYMDTVHRSVLDFDFEKVCSVSLETNNVYACLVCGKYYQGRGRNTHAYFHSLDQGHHVFINLDTEKVYCLPDGYEIIDPTLQDIKNAVNPKMDPEQVAGLNLKATRCRAFDGTAYDRGIMGMNNLHATDYANAVLQALVTVTPFRDFCLLFPRKGRGSALMRRLGELVRKLYNPHAFRAHVSPHEFMQEAVDRSSRRFKILEQGDPVEFLAWLLNTLHADLQNDKGHSVITRTFRGWVRMTTEKEKAPNESTVDASSGIRVSRKTKRVPFFFLSLEVPPLPLFKDSSDRKLLPQVPLHNLLQKFNGQREHHIVKSGERRVYTFETLPKYLIMNIKRFTRNNFFMEKNPTIVPFPAKNLEMREFLPPDVARKTASTKYDLVAAVVHEGPHRGGTYTVNVRHLPTSKWFQIQDLNVTETFPQLVTLAEAHILIYEVQQPTSSG